MLNVDYSVGDWCQKEKIVLLVLSVSRNMNIAWLLFSKIVLAYVQLGQLNRILHRDRTSPFIIFFVTLQLQFTDVSQKEWMKQPFGQEIVPYLVMMTEKYIKFVIWKCFGFVFVFRN
jgi:hypothetical protein